MNILIKLADFVMSGYALGYYLIDLPVHHSAIMTVADYIASKLHKTGVRHIFGIPGGPSIPYMEAFRRAGIEFILTANEAAAGIMADVTARLTGIPGVCHATFGPGATNISTGIGGAFLDRSPVIVLTSEMDDTMIGRIAQMNISHQKLFAPITKATFRMSPANAREVMERALIICRQEYPGPVHIGLPSDIAGKEIIDSDAPVYSNTLQATSNNIEQIRILLENSKRPVIAAGLTAKRLNAGKLLASFLDKYNIPVVLTPMAKGILPPGHPSFAGVLFHAASNLLEPLFDKTDLVIGIGYDPVEYNYEQWMPDVPLVHFDTKETDMPGSQNVSGYTGDPEEWFRCLSWLKAGNLVTEQETVQNIRAEMISLFNGFTTKFGPCAALKIMREVMPADTVLTADVGSHLHLAGQYWDQGEKGDFIITNGWSGMGFGVPAALAVQLVNPGVPVACLTGDGGFLMMAGEIVTAVRHKLPVIIVVFSDGELNLIKLKQSWKDLQPYGTTLYRGDLFGTDRFLGIKVLRADSHETMRRALSGALRLHEPVIINALIDPGDYEQLIVKR